MIERTLSIVALDLEATGPDPQRDRITQFALVGHGDSFTALVNPGRDIPEEVVKLTGITNEMVSNAKPFSHHAPHIAAAIKGLPIVTYNGLRFDIPLLAEEFERVGVEDYEFGPIIDVDALYKQHHTRTLSDAVLTYLERKHGGAHEAEADAQATLEVFQAMRHLHPKVGELFANKPLDEALRGAAELSCHGRMPADPHGILAYENGVMVYTHKKVRGVPVADDIGYAHWILRSDFPASTKRTLRKEIERIEAANRREEDTFIVAEDDGEPC